MSAILHIIIICTYVPNPHHGPSGRDGYNPRMSPVQTSSQEAPDDLVSRVAAVLLVAGFVVFFPGGLYRFLLPKLLVVAAGVLLAAWSPPAGRLPRTVVWVLAGCAGVLVLAALVSPAPWAQLVGRWPRYEGLVALTLYAGALWAGARLWGPRASAQRRGWALTVLSWASVVLAVVAVAEAAGLRPLGGDVSRPGALLGNASDQGTVGAVVLGVLLAHLWPGARSPVRRWLLVAAVVAAGATVVTSGSRGAFGAALVAAVVCGWARIRSVRHVRGAVVPAALGLALVAGALLAPGGIAHRLDETDAVASSSAQGRWTMAGTAADLVASRPVTGAGPSGFVDQAPAHLPPSWWAEQDPSMGLDSPHSVVLQVVVAGGTLLALLAVVLLVVMVLAARDRWRAERERSGDRSDGDRSDPAGTRWLVGGFAGVAAAGVALSVSFTSAATVPLVAALAGSLVAVGLRTESRRTGRRKSEVVVDDRRPVIAWSVAAGVLVIVLVPAVGAEIPLDQAGQAASRGDVKAATQALDTAHTLRPWDADVDMLGTCFLAPLAMYQDADAAVAADKHARRALARVPESTETLRCAAQASISLDDFVLARERLDKALRLSPDNPELLLLSGYTYAATGDLDKAAADLQAATTNPFTADLANDMLAQVAEARTQQ